MTFALRSLSLAAIAAIAFTLAPAAFAQDAMSTDAMSTDAMATDAMAPAGGAMMAGDAMMSDDELTLCLEQAGAISFPQVMEAASAACHDLHNGMTGDAMAADAMAPATK